MKLYSEKRKEVIFKKIEKFIISGPGPPQNYLSHAITQNKNVCRMFNLLLAVDAIEKRDFLLKF